MLSKLLPLGPCKGSSVSVVLSWGLAETRFPLEGCPEGVKLGYAPGSKVWCLDKADGSRSVADAKGYGSASDVNRKNAALEVMKELALKLASADPKTMGMLKSPGFFDDTNAYRFILHFPYPRGNEPPSDSAAIADGCQKQEWPRALPQ